MKNTLILLTALLVNLSACSDNSLYKSGNFKIYADKVVQDGKTATIVSPVEITSDFNGGKTWKPSADISSYPQFSSDIPLLDAMYNLSLDELAKITTSGMLKSSPSSDGLSTVDIGYASFLSLLMADPEAVKTSLLSCTEAGRIKQGDGIGGSWPVSTDRIIWILAAWDYFKYTNDRQFLFDAFAIVGNTLNDDKKVAYNSKIGMMSGGGYFNNTPGVSMPSYMEPIDIYSVMSLTQNALYHQAFKIQEAIANELGMPSENYISDSKRVAIGISKNLWNAKAGYYDQFLYGGKYFISSSRSESLGSAVSLLFDLPSDEQVASISSNVPGSVFGYPAFYPNVAGAETDINNAVYPMINAFWAWGGAKVKKESNINYAIASIYRPAALMLTNPKRVSATTGNTEGLKYQADGHIWSIAANLALVYRVYFGLDIQAKRLAFFPSVPKNLTGVKKLTGLKYQNMTLDITVSGYGTGIRSMTLDGEPLDLYAIDSKLEGHHTIDIVLNEQSSVSTVNIQPMIDALPDITYKQDGNNFAFTGGENISKFKVFQNGTITNEADNAYFTMADSKLSSEYMFTALDKQGYTVYSGPTVLQNSPENTIIIEVESVATGNPSISATGFTGKGYSEFTTKANKNVKFNVNIEKEGIYLIDCRYANGSGPVDSGDKCGIRQLYVGSTLMDAFVMPQRGQDAWSDWGYSNTLRARLGKGRHTLSLVYESQTENMNMDVNTVLLDHIRMVKE